MTQPKKVREVYAELKAMLGDSVSSAELLECAGMMVEVSGGKDRRRFGAMTPRATFDELSLDVLFEQHPWRVVCREWRPDPDELVEVYHQPGQLIEQVLQAAA